jgi:hypothetical protein
MTRTFEAYLDLQDPRSAAPSPYPEADVFELPIDVVESAELPTTPIRVSWAKYNDGNKWRQSPAGTASIMTLLRYMVEIIAFTFGMDLGLLNAALDQPPNAISVLSADDRNDLRGLANLIRSMQSKIGRPSWLTVADSDCALVIEGVSKPVNILKLDGNFAFQLLDSYCDHQ